MAAPGWYPDGQGAERYWDGQAWTAHSRAATAAGSGGETMMAPSAAAAAPAPQHQPQPAQQPYQQQPHQHPYHAPVPPASGGGSGKTVLVVVAAVVGVLLLGGIATVVALVANGESSEDKARDASSELADDLVSISPTDGPSPDFSFDYEGDPESVAQAYFDAYVAEDCTFLDHFAPDTLAEYGLSVDACRTQPDLFFTDEQGGCALDLGEVTTTGETASGTYEIGGCSIEESNEAGSIEWVLLGGEWKIQDLYPDA